MDSEKRASLRLYSKKEKAPELDLEKKIAILSGSSGNDKFVSIVKTEPATRNCHQELTSIPLRGSPRKEVGDKLDPGP